MTATQNMTNSTKLGPHMCRKTSMHTLYSPGSQNLTGPLAEREKIKGQSLLLLQLRPIMIPMPRFRKQT